MTKQTNLTTFYEFGLREQILECLERHRSGLTDSQLKLELGLKADDDSLPMIRSSLGKRGLLGAVMRSGKYHKREGKQVWAIARYRKK